MTTSPSVSAARWSVLCRRCSYSPSRRPRRAKPRVLAEPSPRRRRDVIAFILAVGARHGISNWRPAARPTRSAISGVIGGRLAVPRMPSVPKYLRVMGRYVGGHNLHDDVKRLEAAFSATATITCSGGRQCANPLAALSPNAKRGQISAARASALVRDRAPDGERLDGFGDVVDADDLDAPVEAG